MYKCYDISIVKTVAFFSPALRMGHGDKGCYRRIKKEKCFVTG